MPSKKVQQASSLRVADYYLAGRHCVEVHRERIVQNTIDSGRRDMAWHGSICILVPYQYLSEFDRDSDTSCIRFGFVCSMPAV